MKKDDIRYSEFSLVKEMYETVEIIRNFNPQDCMPFVNRVKTKDQIFLTGEGSSRIFPAKRAVYNGRKASGINVFTEASLSAMEFDLANSAVFAASYSGKTKEAISLLNHLEKNQHDAFFCSCAFQDALLFQTSLDGYLLKCGEEKAVAATKSVVEHGLFYQVMLLLIQNNSMINFERASQDFLTVLDLNPEVIIIESISQASSIFFAGKNNGVAEELTLKTNEIARKKSGYLEATYLLHGIEEVLSPKEDIIVLIDPYEQEEQKIYEIYCRQHGISVIAIADRQTMFPTFIIPQNIEFSEYLQLAAGWNLLVEIGLVNEINMDQTEKARKVGNMAESL